MQEDNNSNIAADLYKKKHSSGDYLDYSIEYFRQNMKSLFLMTLIFHVPITFIIFFLIDYGNYTKTLMELSMSDEPELLLGKVILMYVGLILYAFYQMTFVNVISLGTIKHTYENIVNNNVMTVKQSLKHGFKRVLWYFLYLIIISFAVGVAYNLLSVFFMVFLVGMIAGNELLLGFIVFLIVLIVLTCIVFFIYFSLRMYFVPHAISIEKLDCFRAFKLSLKLTKKKVRYIIWPIFFALIFVGFIPSAIQSLSQFLPFDDPLVNRIIAALAVAASGLIYPYNFVHTTQLYIFLKNEKGLIDFNNKLDELVKNESDRITFGQPNEVVK